jgi:hypothetical protein
MISPPHPSNYIALFPYCSLFLCNSFKLILSLLYFRVSLPLRLFFLYVFCSMFPVYSSSFFVYLFLRMLVFYHIQRHIFHVIPIELDGCTKFNLALVLRMADFEPALSRLSLSPSASVNRIAFDISTQCFTASSLQHMSGEQQRIQFS